MFADGLVDLGVANQLHDEADRAGGEADDGLDEGIHRVLQDAHELRRVVGEVPEAVAAAAD